nr:MULTISPECIES: hypothetical protein [unclassified Brevundimonas]
MDAMFAALRHFEDQGCARAVVFEPDQGFSVGATAHFEQSAPIRRFAQSNRDAQSALHRTVQVVMPGQFVAGADMGPDDPALDACDGSAVAQRLKPAKDRRASQGQQQGSSGHRRTFHLAMAQMFDMVGGEGGAVAGANDRPEESGLQKIWTHQGARAGEFRPGVNNVRDCRAHRTKTGSAQEAVSMGGV